MEYLFHILKVVDLVDADVLHGKGLVIPTSGLPYICKAACSERAFVCGG